mmetsp:Transcript_272/g.438  ORF Transcript_272/g.438 Transcript_272/m.438 type:complete len:370 (+) Transcript_272:81-1190(+)
MRFLSLQICAILISGHSIGSVDAFSAVNNPRTPSSSASTAANNDENQQDVGNILILDHLNINHEKGHHDWVKSFYFSFLGCGVDPRKEENLKLGKKTLWANIGANQFHLPEGKPNAQVLEGVITLTYPNLDGLKGRLETAMAELKDGSKFDLLEETEDSMVVSDPWGSKFCLVQANNEDELDSRGVQSGPPSEGYGMKDLTIYTPTNCNMEGIARFYEKIMGAPILDCSKDKCSISVGPKQTLRFVSHPEGKNNVCHDDLRNEEEEEGKQHYLSNYGPHISMYVSNLKATYEKASELGVSYVNPRFKRRAYSLEEARDQCMFRIIDIVDPDNVQDGPILKLEHEIRSVVKVDGSLYKSCPFDDIPPNCV